MHMYVPARLLPLYVFVTGRQQCCGVLRRSAHLAGCPRHPWKRRPGQGSPSLDAATS